MSGVVKDWQCKDNKITLQLYSTVLFTLILSVGTLKGLLGKSQGKYYKELAPI